MINIEDKSKCCGCFACYNKCSKNAIEMISDENGFKYPKINKELCINCGLCEKVCPYNNEYEKKSVYEKSLAYGGWNCDEKIKSISTSGGIFSYLSKKIIEKNGVVCGAIYDKNLNVIHAIVDNMKDLKKINGSKYVQSNIGDNYKNIKKLLDEGRYVLFSGTPCQVSGLNSFLGKEYDKLYTCDIVCHGVPSPKVFDKYKNNLENKFSSKLVKINFRDKISGWQGYSFSAEFENGKKYIQNSKENEYMKIFIGDIDLRESCPTCKFAKLPRNCDFTLGDFWGVDNCYPELNQDNSGTSLVLVHTEKGKTLLEGSDIYIKECDLDIAIKGNPSILTHKSAHKCRNEFLNEIDEYTIEELAIKYFPKPNLVKRIIKKFLKIIKKNRI